MTEENLAVLEVLLDNFNKRPDHCLEREHFEGELVEKIGNIFCSTHSFKAETDLRNLLENKDDCIRFSALCVLIRAKDASIKLQPETLETIEKIKNSQNPRDLLICRSTTKRLNDETMKAKK